MIKLWLIVLVPIAVALAYMIGVGHYHRPQFQNVYRDWHRQ